MAKQVLLIDDELQFVLMSLDDEQRGIMLSAMIRYFRGDEKAMPTNPLLDSTFGTIRERLQEQIDRLKNIKENRRLAGIKSGEARRFASEQTRTPVEQTRTPVEQNGTSVQEEQSKQQIITTKQQPKTIGERKPKKLYGECVYLTNEEYEKLCANYTEDGTRWMIDKLDGYKLAKGVTYKSDYRAILNWVTNEYEKYRQQNGTATNWGFNSAVSAKEQRDAEFACYIASKLGSDSNT